MSETNVTFDHIFRFINADDLKKMVRGYHHAGPPSERIRLRKQQCIDFISQTLADPQAARRVVTTLSPVRKLALATLKLIDDDLTPDTLTIAILASGINIPSWLEGKRNVIGTALLENLAEHGLVMDSSWRAAKGRIYSSSFRSVYSAFSDPRLLAHVGLPPVKELNLKTTTPKHDTSMRHPSRVMLDIIGLLQTIDNMGGLGYTKQRTIRVSDLRKFQKTLQWSQPDIEIDGFMLRDAPKGLLFALQNAEFLVEEQKKLILKYSVEEVADQNPAKQIERLMVGFIRNADWLEARETVPQIDLELVRDFRVALMLMLRALPPDSDEFFTFSSLSNRLYLRIGEQFSLGRGRVHNYIRIRRDASGKMAGVEQDSHEANQLRWRKYEHFWLQDALSSWLYYLGMVELYVKEQQIVAFRLTQLGKAALHPEKSFDIASQTTLDDSNDEPETNAEAWIVQPNFDIIVYMDKTTPTQLAFLEGHAERIQSQQYTAHYRLTRESVYRGLERGTGTVDDFVATLERHAQAPLPDNIRIEIAEWSALREQIRLHHRANLLEFASAADRQIALDNKLPSTPIGDQYLLLSPTVDVFQLSSYVRDIHRVNYEYLLTKVLETNEHGLIKIKADSSDLLLPGKLDNWAERTGANQWQLTEASVKANVKAGGRINELQQLLDARRLSHSHIPPMLNVALSNWAGRPQKTELGSIIVVRCPNNHTAVALRQSTRLKPYYRGSSESTVLFFDGAHENEVRAFLSWAGFNLDVMMAE
ncbi:MAG: helicase-associated domain-containing protein [Chloroflexota bacterium]